MNDYKYYKAPEPVNVIRQSTILLIAVIFAAIAYTSESDYQECMSWNKSIALCGGGNNK